MVLWVCFLRQGNGRHGLGVGAGGYVIRPYKGRLKTILSFRRLEMVETVSGNRHGQGVCRRHARVGCFLKPRAWLCHTPYTCFLTVLGFGWLWK
ncbi:hypothetical protein [Neisseria zalophi]|uniref:Uncharacterized protein n=1 Tax=Neisseria zalophi TaxID=640030 RepID=A0A5J6PRR6_9NEIS|nr:hypothetical protein [Neisseria zalophi]QEY25458.1 hypothetical protein D0T92_02155 [Neisseria zalophi]